MMNVELHEVEINWMTIKDTKQKKPQKTQKIKKQMCRYEIWIQIKNRIYIVIIFTQPLRSGRIWHKVNS